jgi:AraC-like DNA-binding protein
MTAPLDDIRILRFSTDEVPERDRAAVMREVYGRSVVRMDIEPVHGEPAQLRLVARSLPGLVAASYSLSPQVARRTPEHLADGNDDVVLSMSPTGGHVVSHLGRELSIGGSVGLLMSTADRAQINIPSMQDRLSLALSRRKLADMVPGLEDAFMRPIPQNAEALRLLTSYVRLLDGALTLTTPEVRRSFICHVYDLAALAIGASRDAAEIAKDRGVRAARLHAIKADILASSNQHKLTLAALAVRHGVTPRYVQMLFEHEGTTFSRFLLDQRLTRAHRMLNDRELADRTVGAIAYEAGFGDLSHFNRAFRRRYGESPSQVRSLARSGNS